MAADGAVLGEIGIAAFLRDHWQRKPLLIRSAMPGFTDPLTPEELAGLALDEGVESRLIQEKRGRFTLRHGPFAETDFTGMPAKQWTLLVQAVDQLVPAVTALREPFRFLPDWRIDDVMISYAAPGGSVGAHYDNYDVFLLQGRGRRRWLVGPYCDDATPLVANAPLRLIDGFVPEWEAVLEPGDMLYLPPRYGHHGIAVDACMTYSIGFRAPGAADVLSGVAESIANELSDLPRYADPGLAAAANPGEIDEAAIDRVADLLRRHLGDPAALARWLGQYMTEPKYEHSVAPRRRRMSADALKAQIAAGRGLDRTPGARVAFTVTGDGLLFFANGTAQAVMDTEAAALAKLVCAEMHLAADRLGPFLAMPAAAALLLALVNDGTLEPA